MVVVCAVIPCSVVLPVVPPVACSVTSVIVDISKLGRVKSIIVGPIRLSVLTDCALGGRLDNDVISLAELVISSVSGSVLGTIVVVSVKKLTDVVPIDDDIIVAANCCAVVSVPADIVMLVSDGIDSLVVVSVDVDSLDVVPLGVDSVVVVAGNVDSVAVDLTVVDSVKTDSDAVNSLVVVSIGDDSLTVV